MQDDGKDRISAALQSNDATVFIASISSALRDSRAAFPLLRRHLGYLMVRVGTIARLDVEGGVAAAAPAMLPRSAASC